eukprot:m.230562 g.230562  ORF g.230562 m.230562 type:complete len:108 (+) comp12081_c0_seq1:340-663(+)
MGSTSGSSAHIKSGAFTGTMKSIWRGIKSMQVQGNVLQQGGAFVLGPGSAVHFAHNDAGPMDHAEINTLLEAANLPPFFPASKHAKAASSDDGAASGPTAASDAGAE